MNAAKRLKIIRKKLKLTQEKLAISMGIKREHVTSLESEKVKISTLHALALEYVHGVNKEWLLHGKGQMILSKSDKGNSNPAVTKIVIEHQGIVKRFKNPEKGLENNEHLLGIEAANDELYNKVSDYLKTTHDTVKIMKEGEQKKTSSTPKKRGNGE